MTTILESIEDIAALVHKIRTETHLAEGTVVKIIEMVLQKQATDRQLAMNEAQLGLTQRPGDNVIPLHADEKIEGSDHPEEDA